MSVELSATTLTAAGLVWQEQGEQLRGAGASLDDVDPAAVGERASSALEGFAGHWAERVRALQGTSHEHGVALLGAVEGFGRSDERAADHVDRLRGLLEGER